MSNYEHRCNCRSIAAIGMVPSRIELSRDIVQQVKIFKSIDNELGQLEQEINVWIAENGVNILSIHGNIAPQAGKHAIQGSFSAADVLVIVLYEAN